MDLCKFFHFLNENLFLVAALMYCSIDSLFAKRKKSARDLSEQGEGGYALTLNFQFRIMTLAGSDCVFSDMAFYP